MSLWKEHDMDELNERTMGEKHILIAVDETENAKRAVLYVASLLGGFPGFRVTVFHIVSEPSEDFFETDESRAEWLRDEESKAARMLENYRQVLVQSGFEEGKVAPVVVVRRCPSIAECIFKEVERLKACTVVLGRRRISRQEEFLFGSTSDKMLHTARNCAVWVVE